MRFVLLLLLVLIWMLLLFCPCDAWAEVEEVPFEFITAGIRFYDSKIKTVQFDGILDYVMAGDRYRFEYVLAYEGLKSFLDLHHQLSAKPQNAKLAFENYTVEYVFDDERTWWLYKEVFSTNYNVITGRNFAADFDPRFYIARSRDGYARQTLDEYLVKNGAQVVGEETIEVKHGTQTFKEPCYLITFNRKGTKEVEKFWLSKTSFRLVKHQLKRNKTDGMYRYDFSIIYKQFPDEIWYPISIEWDSSDYFPDGSKQPSNIGTMRLSNIKINTDVSERFHFNVPPFVEIVDFDTNEVYIASELFGRTADEPPKTGGMLEHKENGNDEMVLIPAGEFRIGSDLGNENETPINTVYLDSYYIDRYEVTNREYAAFLNAVGKTDDVDVHWFIDLESRYCRIKHVDGKYQVQQGYEHHPVLTVSWSGADAYAKWHGKRLPTEVEWEKAARGGIEGKEYPWGDTASHAHANYEGTDGMDSWLFTAPVGSFEPNGYGLYDMSGNAGEWCADLYDSDAYKPAHLRTPEKSNLSPNRVVRGGSWATDAPYLRCAFRTASDPSWMHGTIGFRCAMDVSAKTGN
jgi:formylglycine-generating enzyme required for sulfatase activity